MHLNPRRPFERWPRFSPALVIGVAVLLAELVSAAWCWNLSRGADASGCLAFAVPRADQTAWKEIAVEPAQVGDLKHDRSHRFLFTPGRGVSVEFLSLEFDPGRMDFEEAFAHTAKNCMSCGGFALLREDPNFRVVCDSREFACESILVRDASGQERHVFKALWTHPGYVCKTRLSHGARLALAGKPAIAGSPALILMASISGVPGRQAAWDLFEREGVRRLVPAEALTREKR